MKLSLPFINLDFVSGCDATHCKSANALHTRVLAFDDNTGGESIGYTIIISCNKIEITPYEYHKIGAISGHISLLLLNSVKADSLYNYQYGQDLK